MSTLLHRLRGLFYQEPDAQAWRSLLTLLESAPEGERALALGYASQHLEAWPDELRLSTLHPGQALPRWWPLVRHLRLVFPRWFDKAEPLPRLGNPDSLRQITHLALQHYPEPHLIEDLIAATHLERLRSLELDSTSDFTHCLTELRAAPHLRTLRHLSLRLLSLGFGEQTPRPPLWERLETLLVDRCSHEVLPYLPEMIHVRGLRRLQITRCGLEDAVLGRLAPSLAASSLEHLDLSHNPISDEACAALLARGGWSRLRSFRAENTGAAGKTAQHLARLPLREGRAQR